MTLRIRKRCAKHIIFRGTEIITPQIGGILRPCVVDIGERTEHTAAFHIRIKGGRRTFGAADMILGIDAQFRIAFPAKLIHRARQIEHHAGLQHLQILLQSEVVSHIKCSVAFYGNSKCTPRFVIVASNCNHNIRADFFRRNIPELPVGANRARPNMRLVFGNDLSTLYRLQHHQMRTARYHRRATLFNAK